MPRPAAPPVRWLLRTRCPASHGNHAGLELYFRTRLLRRGAVGRQDVAVLPAAAMKRLEGVEAR